MSTNEIRAAAYSAKCDSRRNRVVRRRERRLNRLQQVCIPFSVGLLLMAALVAVVV